MTPDGVPADAAEPAGAGRRRGSYARYASVGALFVALLLVFQYAGQPTARRLGLVAGRQRFTELYFPRPASLPVTVSSSGALSFTFVVVNEEGARRSYSWSARFHEGSGSALLATGTLALAGGASGPVVVDVAPPNAPAIGTVVVSIASPAQHIDFHLGVVLDRGSGAGRARRSRR